MVKEITLVEWKKDYKTLPGYVLLDVFATWCQPCMRLSPHLDEIANAHPSVTFVKIDIDKEPDFSDEEYSINSLPTILLYNNGKVVDFVLESSHEKITAMIKKIIS